MSTRRILALLVVLALSLGLCSIPAGSATLQRTAVTDETVTAVTACKDGDDGEDIDGGDDDRWGNTNPVQGDNGNNGGVSDEEDESDEVGSDRVLGRFGVLDIGLRAIFGFLVMML